MAGAGVWHREPRQSQADAGPAGGQDGWGLAPLWPSAPRGGWWAVLAQPDLSSGLHFSFASGHTRLCSGAIAGCLLKGHSLQGPGDQVGVLGVNSGARGANPRPLVLPLESLLRQEGQLEPRGHLGPSRGAPSRVPVDLWPSKDQARTELESDRSPSEDPQRNHLPAFLGGWQGEASLKGLQGLSSAGQLQTGPPCVQCERGDAGPQRVPVGPLWH